MEIEAKKLLFIQDVLRVSDVSVIDKLQSVLFEERRNSRARELVPMSVSEFNQKIDQAEHDMITGNVTKAEDLRKQIDRWA